MLRDAEDGVAVGVHVGDRIVLQLDFLLLHFLICGVFAVLIFVARIHGRVTVYVDDFLGGVGGVEHFVFVFVDAVIVLGVVGGGHVEKEEECEAEVKVRK
ncbi:hypothetical protein BHYA_0053g00520 [Botrytis hyacinthi]|uniref:Uncharacterized protein n=1 Tax=Botrytis hyacinthi TaxID=278943 RepID=A0A4Z1GRE4_9HELO|nr:hypothetical protein BHYA_0053g00520 [Botrytis hyacinthi]